MSTSVYFRVILVAWVIVIYNHNLFGQSEVPKDMPTSKVDARVNDDARDKRPPAENIQFIYQKTNRKKSLVGNPCAIQATRKMGFEYTLEHNPNAGFRSNFSRSKHNFGVKTKLFFTRGPWWKATVNKRIKNCAKKSGDRRG